ncbi:MAG: FAD-dependent oxidoreductase [Eubacterium sp.]|nr:FAD-dependent oxidoreductase [Eubacterium sp.]
MLELGQIKIPVGDADRFGDEWDRLKEITAKKLKINPENMRKYEIYKRSIDARNKPDIFFVYSVRFQTSDEETVLKKNRRNKNLRQVKNPVKYEAKLTQLRGRDERIVIAGSGPAGLFAAYALSLRGLNPVIIERGAPMEERIAEVESFWKTGVLNEESNVCFGEGGAGTFSDGKLNSGVKDSDGAKRFILETFVRFGARREILYDAKPHIGTDVLRNVIINMRRAMERQGVTFFFHTKMSGIMQRDGKLTGILVEQENALSRGVSPFEELYSEDAIECDRLILAIGHSARDTFELLHDDGIEMSSKAFAVGVRVQHLQSDIDRAQYGISEKDNLPAAYYKLTGKSSEGLGVYSFCMCPGGYVVNSSSESGYLVVNGMSDADRDSGYANAAIVVTVNPGEEVFAGLEYQRELERAMYTLSDGQIPVQRYVDFKSESDGSGVGKLLRNQPAVKGLWTYADVRSALPDDIATAVCDAIDQFGKKIQGFDSDDTLILGLESRTSSPVRIVRDEESMQSNSLSGLYPCGEGAGYAGGILSAAMDGMRVAERICSEIIEKQ